MKSISICRTDTTVQRRTSIQVLPVCVLRETEQSGHLNVRTVLRHYVPNKGLRPLRCFAAILVDINCLTNTPLSRGIFFNVESSRVCRNVLNFRLFRYPLEYDAQAAPKPPNSIPKIRKKLRQHRIIPALRLKHRSGGCRTSLAVSALRIMRYCPNHHSVIFVLPLGQKGFILVYEW